jgi:hypothetical protein
VPGHDLLDPGWVRVGDQYLVRAPDPRADHSPRQKLAHLAAADNGYGFARFLHGGSIAELSVPETFKAQDLGPHNPARFPELQAFAPAR